MVQVEGFRASRLLLKIVLQLSPFAHIGATTAAMDRGVLFGVVWDVHPDCATRFAVEFVI